jgi:hypothetical protein
MARTGRIAMTRGSDLLRPPESPSKTAQPEPAVSAT